MATSNAPRRRLGAALRDLREGAGLRQEQVAETIGWSRSKVGYVESGQGAIDLPGLNALLELYGVSPDDRETRGALEALARQARSRRRAWWRRYDDVLPAKFDVYLGLEAEATELLNYESTLVPGLLQTEEYAEAIIRGANPTIADEERGRRLELRMQRKARLTESDAPTLWVALDEAVLRRVVGGRDVMREQLRYLADVSRRPNVMVQVLPFEVGEHIAVVGSFVLLRFGPNDPATAYVEYRTGSLILEDRSEVAQYSLMVDHLRVRAVNEDLSRALIISAAEGMV